MPEKLLLVDDTPANLALLRDLLEPHGYDLAVASSGEMACELVPKFAPDLILLDVVMPDLSGYETCRRLKSLPLVSDIPILFVSARDDPTAVVDAFHVGGVDYITKPFQPEEVLARVQTHLKLARLNRELRAKNQELTSTNEQLRQESDRRRKTEDALHVADEKLSLVSNREVEHWGLEAFVGKSRLMARILTDIRRLQDFSSVNVLITGESGTGKELVARAIHFGSNRARGPFIPVNCVAIPPELAESMFFGHLRGSFTGATMDRKGCFELADGGTLFLDEIGDMALSLQAKLLRVLEDGYVTAIGASSGKKVDVRVVAATNADVSSQVASGHFRRDVYFRLAQFAVQVPPLRERKDDIPLLAEHFLALFAKEMGLTPPALSRGTLQRLQNYSYPGNIRELKNIIERSLIEASGSPTIEPEHIAMDPDLFRTVADTDVAALDTDGIDDLPLNLERAEAVLIKRALEQTNGNVAQAARLLGINRTRIYRKFQGEQVAPD